MFLKLLLIALVIYMLYKAFGGSFALPKSNPKTKADKEVEANTLVECSSCGVYITRKEAIIKSGKIYCSDCA
jgi:uncharacterized protein